VLALTCMHTSPDAMMSVAAPAAFTQLRARACRALTATRRWWIIGVAAGALVLVMLLLVCACCIASRRSKRNKCVLVCVRVRACSHARCRARSEGNLTPMAAVHTSPASEYGLVQARTPSQTYVCVRVCVIKMCERLTALRQVRLRSCQRSVHTESCTSWRHVCTDVRI
jgi:hypothetical protein